MIYRCTAWVDALLSRAVVEPRFVARQATRRATWLAEMRARIEALDGVDWFAAPPTLVPSQVAVGRYCDALTKTILWESPSVAASSLFAMSPHSGPPIATLHGNRGRAVWVLVHGWLGGNLAYDRWGWPFQRLLESFDAVCFTLPGHGKRKHPAQNSLPTFPSRNPVANAIGLAIAVAELRQLVSWLRGHGYDRIGIAGTSLGGYVASLFATASADCEQLLLDRPLVRMSEPLRRVANREGAAHRQLLEHLEAVYAVVDPLRRELKLPRERVALLLGEHDRISGLAAGEALASHWHVEAERFPGSHVIPWGRSERLWRLFSALTERSA
ncbi:MAG: alpha/beta fold hydrolase [Myxococcales bacterium]